MRDFLSARFNLLSKFACFLFGMAIFLPLRFAFISISGAIFFDFLSMKFQKENCCVPHK